MTVNVVRTVLSKPVAVIEVAVPGTVWLWPPVQVTAYSRIGVPSSGAAFHVKRSVVSCGFETAKPVTAPGTVFGIALGEGLLAGPKPTRFCARTVNEYDLPLVSPMIVHGEAGQVCDPPL